MTTVTRRAVLSGGAAVAGAALLGGCRRARPRPGAASLWFSYGGKNREVLLELVARFHRAQGRYAVDPVYQGDYFEALAKLRTALHAGVAPSLTHVVGEVLPYLAEAGVLAPLDGHPGAQELDLVPEVAQAGSFVDGARRPLFGLPFNRSTPIAYYNRTLFRELGLEPPRTWSELREVARAATARRGEDTSRWGFATPIDWWFWVALVGQAGGEVFTRDGEPTLGGEAGVRALELWQTLVHEDRSMKPPPGRDYNAWQATNTDFLAGRVGLIWTSTAFLRYLEENARFEVGAAPLPRDVRHAVPTGGTMFVIPKQAPAEEQEAAWAFLRFMMEPEQAVDWATRTGYMPVTRAALRRLDAEGYYARHPNDRVAVAQLEHAVAWPWSTRLFRVQREAVQPRLEAAVLGRASARAVLDEARRAAREV